MPTHFQHRSPCSVRLCDYVCTSYEPQQIQVNRVFLLMSIHGSLMKPHSPHNCSCNSCSENLGQHSPLANSYWLVPPAIQNHTTLRTKYNRFFRTIIQCKVALILSISWRCSHVIMGNISHKLRGSHITSGLEVKFCCCCFVLK